jgi:hypothetical protein
MFQLVDESQGYWTQVSITIPLPNGGTRVKKLRGRFKYLTQSRIDDILTRGMSQESGEDEESKGLLDEVLMEWDAFTDKDDKTIEFSDEHRKQALDTPFIRSGFLQAFFSSINGNGAQARGKN